MSGVTGGEFVTGSAFPRVGNRESPTSNCRFVRDDINNSSVVIERAFLYKTCAAFGATTAFAFVRVVCVCVRACVRTCTFACTRDSTSS